MKKLVFVVEEYVVALYPLDVVVGVSPAESADLTPKRDRDLH